MLKEFEDYSKSCDEPLKILSKGANLTIYVLGRSVWHCCGKWTEVWALYFAKKDTKKLSIFQWLIQESSDECLNDREMERMEQIGRELIDKNQKHSSQ